MPQANADWIITGKLYVPRARARLVLRPRLTRQIAASSSPLVLISAPPGFGKTTLLSEWAAHPGRPIAWLSLDEGDNDPIRFWSYVIASLQTVHPSVGVHAGTLLRTQQAMGVHSESVLASLLNDLAGLPDPPTLTLVIDDYHLIRNPTIDDALAFLIDHLPPSLHLLLSSRTDPNLPLARLRAGNALTEFREADLRFTPAEAAEFLNQVMGLRLSETEVALLEARTEGWIAGLQLAALSLSQCADATAFLTTFAGSNRYIFDYLVEQVLGEQPEEIRSFLLDTCILDRLAGPLCDVLTGGSNGAGRLEELERTNLFVVPLDDERRWYRYHHLFVEFLRHHLRRTRADALPVLYRRAAGWCAENGLGDEAIRYAQAAMDFELAGQLIAQHASPAILRGEFVTVHNWLQPLPDRLIRTSLPLSLALGWVQLVAGQLDAAEERLHDAERLFPREDSSPETQSLRGHAAALRAFVSSYRGDFAGTITLARAALEQLPADHGALRSMLNLSLGNACWRRGELQAAEQAVTQALAMAGTPDGPPVDIIHYATQCMAEMQLIQGHLREAAQTYRHGLELAQAHGEGLSVTRGQTLVGLGNILREWNDLDAAIEDIQQGIELARQGQNAFIALKGYIALGQTQAARGDMKEARAAFESAHQIAEQWPSSGFREQVEALQVCLALTSDDAQAVVRWVETRGAELRSELAQGDRNTAAGPFREQEYVVLARALIAQGRQQFSERHLNDGLELLKRLTAAAETGGRTGRVVELLVLTALAESALANHAASRAALEKALALAEPEGYVRLFVDEGEPVRLLLSEFARRETLDDGQVGKQIPSRTYVTRLLAAFSDRVLPPLPEPRIEKGKSETLDVSLTERELEVLQLVAKGRSNQEIADQLVLTLGTVKWYVNQILSKLDAHSRTQAVARAREMGLPL